MNLARNDNFWVTVVIRRCLVDNRGGFAKVKKSIIQWIYRPIGLLRCIILFAKNMRGQRAVQNSRVGCLETRTVNNHETLLLHITKKFYHKSAFDLFELLSISVVMCYMYLFWTDFIARVTYIIYNDRMGGRILPVFSPLWSPVHISQLEHCVGLIYNICTMFHKYCISLGKKVVSKKACSINIKCIVKHAEKE